MENLTIHSSHKAQAGNYFSSIFWMAAMLLLLVSLNTFGHHIIGKYSTVQSRHGRYYSDNVRESDTSKQVTSYREFWNIPTLDKESDDTILLIFMAIAGVIGAGVFCSNTFRVINTFYDTKTVTTVFKTGEGKISENCYGFPLKRMTIEQKFDRITGVEIMQGSVDTLLGTGSITLELMTYANADTIKSEWDIENVENPQDVARRILEGLPQYEGVKVVVKNDKAA